MKSRPRANERTNEKPPADRGRALSAGGFRSSPLLISRDVSRPRAVEGRSPLDDEVVPRRQATRNVNLSLTLIKRKAVNNG
jgi:hypothetical protein